LPSSSEHRIIAYKRNYVHEHRATTGVVLKQYHNIKDTDSIDGTCITDDNDKRDIVPDITLRTVAAATLSMQLIPAPHPLLVTDESPDDTTHTLRAQKPLCTTR